TPAAGLRHGLGGRCHVLGLLVAGLAALGLGLALGRLFLGALLGLPLRLGFGLALALGFFLTLLAFGRFTDQTLLAFLDLRVHGRVFLLLLLQLGLNPRLFGLQLAA